MTKKAGMWALNFLAAIGLIAIFLFGFFMLMYVLSPSDISEVKAAVAEVTTGSRLINFFRISDILDSPVDCTGLKTIIDSFYTKKPNYVFKINDVEQCSRGELSDKTTAVDLILPDYNGIVYNVILEVDS